MLIVALIVCILLLLGTSIFLYRDRNSEYFRAENAVNAHLSMKAENINLEQTVNKVIAQNSLLRQENERIRGFNGELVDKCNSFERQKDKWKSLKEEIAAHQHKKPSGSRSPRKSQTQKNKQHRK